MSGTVVPWSGDPNAMAVLQPRRQRSRLTIIAIVGLGLAMLLVGVLLLLIGEPVPSVGLDRGRRGVVPAADLVLLLAGPLGAGADPLPLGRARLGR